MNCKGSVSNSCNEKTESNYEGGSESSVLCSGTEKLNGTRFVDFRGMSTDDRHEMKSWVQFVLDQLERVMGTTNSIKISFCHLILQNSNFELSDERKLRFMSKYL